MAQPLPTKMQHCQFELGDTEVIDTFTLDFGSYEPVNRWKRMPECDEFVGARRSKHTLVAWNDALYVFGGDNGKRMLNDMLRFDVKDCSWSRAVTKGTPPAPRYHHSAVVFQSSMFVFGGYTGDLNSNSNLRNKNDLFEYNFNNSQWSEWSIDNRLPPARSAHGAVIYNKSMWIFAGYDGNKRLNDLWTICLADPELSWQEVQQSGEGPPTCCNFPVAVARDSMFVFSGQSGAYITNDMFQFQFIERRWTCIPSAHLLRGSAPPPQRRYGHSMIAYNNNTYLYVFGGVAENNLPNDLYRFDLDDHTWEIINVAPESEVPSGRLFHDVALLNGAMYVCGGTVDNNIRSGELYRFQLASYPRCTLRSDFGRLLDSKQFCDMVFIVGQDEREFPAHTAFVAARSPWLRRKLLRIRGETGENREEKDGESCIEITLQDASSTAFAVALRFMYTDCIYPLVKDCQGPEVISLMMDIYGLALKLEISSLEQLCVEYIESSISRKNVLVALESAERLQLDRLKDFCLRFIVREANYNTIIMSEEFEAVPKTLMVQVIRRRQLPQSASSSHLEAQPVASHYEKVLERDMADFLKNESQGGQEFHDITLVLDGVPILAHKAVLAARCSYFEAMFRSFMPENNNVTITIGETTPSRQAFDSLLRYIYFGDVAMPPEDSLYLLSAPYFFGFTNNRLQAFCKENLDMNVSFQNVVEILEAAHRIGASDMKKHALDIIVHHFPQVALSPKMRSLSRELLLDVLDVVADYMKAKNLTETDA